MTPFTYARVAQATEAIALLKAQPEAKLLGGGTNLLDLMKMGVESPAHIIDLNRLSLTEVEELPESQGVRLGALSRNADVAENPLIKKYYPVLREALLSGASPQLRNRATTGGNLLQRTRCSYFYDPDFPSCNKRQPGSGCGAMEGYNRMHAILGQSDHCIATHPSDMCVALAALEAAVRVRGPQGDRVINFADFHLLPGSTPDRETSLGTDEMVISVDLPLPPAGARSHYLKVRDRSSYAFALVSAAVVVCSEGNHRIKTARIALGGVAHKPWRALAAELMLVGQAPDETVFQAAAQAALSEAKGYRHNSFKIELARRTIVQALTTATANV